MVIVIITILHQTDFMFMATETILLRLDCFTIMVAMLNQRKHFITARVKQTNQ